MRKLLTVLAIFIMSYVLTACTSAEEKRDQEELARLVAESASNNTVAEQFAGLANPWNSSDAQGIEDAVGKTFAIPDEAIDVRYSLLQAEDETMGEVEFFYKNINYSARIEKTDQYIDISGMYYEWTSETDCTINGFTGKKMVLADDMMDVEICNWHDTTNGYMYSISCFGNDLEKNDITAVAALISK